MTDDTTTPYVPPLTPAAIQNADTGLNAYLEARARDFRSLGWNDDGALIETRDGRALLARHIDITLRRARQGEKDRDQALAQNAALRRHAADDERYIRSLQAVLERVRQIAGGCGADLDVRAALRDALNTPLPESVTGPLPIPVFLADAQGAADGPAGAPASAEPSNSSSPAQPPPVTAWDQFCGATMQPGDAASRMTPLTVRPKPCSRRPAHDGPHGNSDRIWWTAPPGPDYLPGYPGKLAEPPADLEYAKQPIQPIATPESVATYKLDHCGPCRDAVFYGWAGHMADRAHGQHLTVIEVGPLAGNPCCCVRCTAAPGPVSVDA